jgi:hypothetical protein
MCCFTTLRKQVVVAFHTFRATESLMLRYYEVLSGQAWPHNQHDWGRYIKEIGDLPTTRM